MQFIYEAIVYSHSYTHVLQRNLSSNETENCNSTRDEHHNLVMHNNFYRTDSISFNFVRDWSQISDYDAFRLDHGQTGTVGR